MKKRTFEKGSQDWLTFRRQFVTATELASLFGLNEYTSASKVYDHKINPQFTENVFTKMGQVLEPAVAKMSEFILKEKVNQFSAGTVDAVLFDDQLKLSATPDAFIGTENEIKHLVELKSTSFDKLSKFDMSPPLHYLLQLATQLYLANVESGYLVIMSVRYPDLPSLAFKLSLDRELFKTLVEPEIVRFWDTFEVKKKMRFVVNKKAASELVDMLLYNIQKIYTDVQHIPEFVWCES